MVSFGGWIQQNLYTAIFMSAAATDTHKWSSQILGHPFLWLAVTLVFVLIGYTWMTGSFDEVTVDPVKKLSPEFVPNNLDEVEAILKQDSMTISNRKDDTRHTPKSMHWFAPYHGFRD